MDEHLKNLALFFKISNRALQFIIFLLKRLMVLLAYRFNDFIIDR
jgi:hypothetical protein